MYCEDVDLNLRARLHGMRTIFVPTAIVYHRLSATGGGASARARLRGQLAVFPKLRLFLRKRRAIPADVDVATMYFSV
jgi:GT2 family glycosyltransferase